MVPKFHLLNWWIGPPQSTTANRAAYLGRSSSSRMKTIETMHKNWILISRLIDSFWKNQNFENFKCPQIRIWLHSWYVTIEILLQIKNHMKKHNFGYIIGMLFGSMIVTINIFISLFIPVRSIILTIENFYSIHDGKRGCVFPMDIWPAFRMEQYKVNDHPYHAPDFMWRHVTYQLQKTKLNSW